MFVQEASLRLYSLPQKRKEKNKNDKEGEREEDGMVTLCVHFCFGAVHRLLFTSKSDRACFVLCAKHRLCEANQASQPQFKSVSYPLASHYP